MAAGLPVPARGWQRAESSGGTRWERSRVRHPGLSHALWPPSKGGSSSSPSLRGGCAASPLCAGQSRVLPLPGIVPCKATPVADGSGRSWRLSCFSARPGLDGSVPCPAAPCPPLGLVGAARGHPLRGTVLGGRALGSCALPPGPLPNAAGGQVGPVHMPLLRPGHVHAESMSFLLINHCENLCLLGAAGLAGCGCGAGALCSSAWGFLPGRGCWRGDGALGCFLLGAVSLEQVGVWDGHAVGPGQRRPLLRAFGSWAPNPCPPHCPPATLPACCAAEHPHPCPGPCPCCGRVLVRKGRWQPRLCSVVPRAPGSPLAP